MHKSLRFTFKASEFVEGLEEGKRSTILFTGLEAPGIWHLALTPGRSGLRPTEEESEEESADDGGDVGDDVLDAAPVQDRLALLPGPEGVELADDGVVEPELGVVGQVKRSLPLGDHRILQGGVLVGEAASSD